MNIITTTNIFISRRLYYDKYDEDGFYPQLICPLTKYGELKQYESTLVEFELIQLPYKDNTYAWIQKNNHVIYGFLGIHGIQLLKSLNGEANVNARRILNSSGRCVYPTTANASFKALMGREP
jgi:hypothetical protein